MFTETALFLVVHKLEKSLNHKGMALGAFMDIEGAFDNTSFSDIITAARECGLEETCCSWVRSLLESRLVHTSIMGSSLTAKVESGCPQRGVLSPLLWNLVFDRFLTITNDLGFRKVGYADNMVIKVQGKFAHTVRDIMQEALNMVVKWAVKEDLNISPHKTAIVPLTNRRNTEGLGPLTLYGKELTMLNRVKYLGVTLDSKLNWNQHLQKITNKQQTTYAVVQRTCGKKWGLRPNRVHWLYTRVIRPSILHGTLMLWSMAMQKTTKAHLGRIQRMACLAITGNMKSTPNTAMEILLNLTLLDLALQVEGRMALYRLHVLRQQADPKAEVGLLSIWKKVSDPLLEIQADHTTSVYYYSKVFSVIIDRDLWKNKDPVFLEDDLIWLTDGSRANLGTGSGIFGFRPNRSFSLPLGKFESLSN